MQNVYAQTFDFSTLLGASQLQKDMVTGSTDQICKQEQTALRQSNPGSDVARCLRSRTIRNKSSIILCIIHNSQQLDSPKLIPGTFNLYFSTLLNDIINLPTCLG